METVVGRCAFVFVMLAYGSAAIAIGSATASDDAYSAASQHSFRSTQMSSHEHDEKCTLRGPASGEKIVYLVQHGVSDNHVNQGKCHEQRDANLTAFGMQQARFMRKNPKLSLALSDVGDRRAQLVVVSPLFRALQTAMLGFGDLNMTWLIDSDIYEDGNGNSCDIADHSKVTSFLLANRRQDLLAQYLKLPRNWDHQETNFTERFHNFTARLRSRPENNIVVVTHAYVLNYNLGTPFLPGNVWPYALTGSGQWRLLPDPSCWRGG